MSDGFLNCPSGFVLSNITLPLKYMFSTITSTGGGRGGGLPGGAGGNATPGGSGGGGAVGDSKGIRRRRPW